MYSRIRVAAAIAAVLFFSLIASVAQPRLEIQSGHELRFFAATGKTYQVQASSSPSNGWANLGPVRAGDGLTNLLYEAHSFSNKYYRVLEIIPGADPGPVLPLNGSFETGALNDSTNWTRAGNRPPARTEVDAHTGTFSMHSLLTNQTASSQEGTLSQNVPSETGLVTGGGSYVFSFWARQITSGPGYVQQYQVQWRNAANSAIGGTGLVNFNGGNGSWTKISAPALIAPQDAFGVRIVFRFVTGALVSSYGEIFIDDVSLQPTSDANGPGSTNLLQFTKSPVAKISWPTLQGVSYEPEYLAGFSNGAWNNLTALMLGDGSIQSIVVPISAERRFIRIKNPATALLPPTNLRTIPAGVSNAITLAWTPSLTPGVIGYRVSYGLSSHPLTNFLLIDNLSTVTITNLVPGQSYHFAVTARTASEETNPDAATITATPNDNLPVVPLYGIQTVLEPATSFDTTNALITRIADRARDRHAREANFNAYDHYLTWYWEERTIDIEIEDRVAKGGTGITFNYTTLTPLGAPEFRAFFRGISTVAEYHGNYSAALIGSNRYSYTLNSKLPENRPLRIGDRVEIEISQFLANPVHGRNNYYGTAMLYIVGQGIVPWQGVGSLLDSFPLPESAWMGGLTTLPYQYSNEPEHRFKQMAGNMSPTNAQRFMLGRRLHHTDFVTGAHSESGNPVFSEQVGKAGPKLIAPSCVACHVNNGRALPPALGSIMSQTVMRVGSDSAGNPHPALGSVLQPIQINGAAEATASISNYTTNSGHYADGTPYILRKPNYIFTGVNPTYFSSRIAPSLVGLGLLEAISEGVIMALADPEDADQDGISGRAHLVPDPETGEMRLGRFGSKASKARLRHQVASALNTDMGVVTTVFPALDGESTNRTPELSDTALDQMTRYVALLGVGARRDLADTNALYGEQLFTLASCVKCHIPSLKTSEFHPMAELRNQNIHPYTDLLLHDMGPGLADNLGEHGAAGSEWRTPPLWSIGFTAGVSGGEAYLHDGRARSIEEAILWHGGEAEASKEAFRNMNAADRAALIKFLKSL